MTDSFYSQAKCYALLKRKQEALDRFQVLSDRNRRYYATSVEDRDFEKMHSEIEQIFKSAAICPGPLAREARILSDEAAAALSWAKRGSQGTADSANLSSVERYLAGVPQLLQGSNVNIEELVLKLKETKGEVQRLAGRLLSSRADAIQSQIAAFESSSHRVALMGSIGGIQLRMKDTKNPGIGCLSGVATFVGLAALFQANRPLLAPLEHSVSQNAFGVTFSLSLFTASAIGGFLGVWAWRRVRNQFYRTQIAVKERGIRNFDRSIAPVREQLEAARADVVKFRSWCAGG